MGEVTHTMTRRVAPLLLVAALVAGCSPSDVSPTTEPPTSAMIPVSTTSASADSTNPTTSATSTTLPTHALDYPEVPISVRALEDDEVSYSIFTRSEQEEDADLPEFVLGNDFTPSNMDLDPPRPVAFTNGTEEDTVIMFSTGDLPDLPLAAGETKTIDFTSLPEEIYRFHIFRGNAKISGFIDMRPGETSITSEPVGTLVQQAPFSGLFSIDVPVGSGWYFNPQFDAVVGVPIGDEWSQGDFQWSLITGAPLRSSGFRLQITDLDDPAQVLDDPTVPDGCELSGTQEVTRSVYSGMESQYACGQATLYLGYLDADGHVLVYAVADAPADPADIALSALDTVVVTPDGSVSVNTELGGPSNLAYSFPTDFGYLVDDSRLHGPYPIDVEDGAVIGGLAARVTVVHTTDAEIRNFDEVEYRIEVNGKAIAELPPGHAVAFDLVDFGADIVYLTVASPPFAAYGVAIDLSYRAPGPPEEMYADSSPVAVEIRSVGAGANAARLGIDELMLPVPVAWADVSDPVHWLYSYRREAAVDDPAEVKLSLVGSQGTRYFLDSVSMEERVLPEEIDRFSEHGLDWIVYQWAPEGHPMVTLLIVEDGINTVLYAMLTSAPEDHFELYQQVLLPMIRGYYVVPSE
jgi:hypothetical protein